MSNQEKIDLDYIFHPSAAFSHPSEVLNDEDLTINEKRSILAAWASDSCSVEDSPTPRRGPLMNVRLEEIIEALRSLDEQSRGRDTALRRMLRKRWLTDRGQAGPSHQNCAR